jgi:hypothetical protein
MPPSCCDTQQLAPTTASHTTQHAQHVSHVSHITHVMHVHHSMQSTRNSTHTWPYTQTLNPHQVY